MKLSLPSIILPALLLSSLLLCGCQATTQGQLTDKGIKPVSSGELTELVAGSTIRLTSIELDATIRFTPEGKMVGRDRQQQEDNGRWQVTDDGALCLKFASWYYGDLRCFTVMPDADGYLLFTNNGAKAYQAKVITRGSGQKTLHANTAQKGHKSRDLKATQQPTPKTLATDTGLALSELAQNCPSCSLQKANLAGRSLIGANLTGADLSGADLSRANLRRAKLQGASLQNANLRYVNLAGAALQDADLSGADLTGANLIMADLSGAQTKGAILEGIHTESTKGLK